jgi:hypothetical protein
MLVINPGPTCVIIRIRDQNICALGITVIFIQQPFLVVLGVLAVPTRVEIFIALDIMPFGLQNSNLLIFDHSIRAGSLFGVGSLEGQVRL